MTDNGTVNRAKQSIELSIQKYMIEELKVKYYSSVHLVFSLRFSLVAILRKILIGNLFVRYNCIKVT